MQKRTGGCLCGAVRFEVKGDPEMLHACHCRNSQLMTGSAFAICLYFPEQDIMITSGDLTTFVRSCDSGRTIDIHFCKTCGSTLVWEPAVLEGKRGLAGGNFDETDWIEGLNNIWCQSKHNWLEITKGPKNKQQGYSSEDFM